MVANGGHYRKNMESGTQFMRNLIDGQKTAAMRKQKLFSKGNSVLFIDNTR